MKDLQHSFRNSDEYHHDPEKCEHAGPKKLLTRSLDANEFENYGRTALDVILKYCTVFLNAYYASRSTSEEIVHSSPDIVSSKGPSKSLLNWYEDLSNKYKEKLWCSELGCKKTNVKPSFSDISKAKISILARASRSSSSKAKVQPFGSKGKASGSSSSKAKVQPHGSKAKAYVSKAKAYVSKAKASPKTLITFRVKIPTTMTGVEEKKGKRKIEGMQMLAANAKQMQVHFKCKCTSNVAFAVHLLCCKPICSLYLQQAFAACICSALAFAQAFAYLFACKHLQVTDMSKMDKNKPKQTKPSTRLEDCKKSKPKAYKSLNGLTRTYLMGQVTDIAQKDKNKQHGQNRARGWKEYKKSKPKGYVEAIVVPPIPAEHFKLKHSLINLVTSKQFFSFEKEDPHAHIRYFNKITSTLKYKDVPETSIKLMLFPFSIDGPAQIWLDKEPSRSILTWDDLVSKFINHFFPPSKTTNLRNEISNFQQRFEETFYEA
ncbi:reverse transcriptase domain-containing protein [Tanacetum coccineum]